MFSLIGYQITKFKGKQLDSERLLDAMVEKYGANPVLKKLQGEIVGFFWHDRDKNKLKAIIDKRLKDLE